MMKSASILLLVVNILCFSLEANSLEWVPTAVHESPSKDVRVSDQWQDSSEPPVLKADIQLKNKKCSCKGTGCQCCMDVKVTLKTLKVCASFALNQQEKALELTVKNDNHVISKEKTSVSFPIEACVEGAFGISAKVCISLEDISFKRGHTGACLYLSVGVSAFQWKIKLFCVYMTTFPRNIMRAKPFMANLQDQ